jgi:HSP20 family protein
MALKNLPERIKREVERAYDNLTEGWRELLNRSNGALTHFTKSKTGTEGRTPQWSLLAAETWETAQSVIIRIELPGMRKQDIDVVLVGNNVRIRGEKKAGSDGPRRTYSLSERAYGHFERIIPIPHPVEETDTEVSYLDGVLTVILRKTQPSPPRLLTIK